MTDLHRQWRFWITGYKHLGDGELLIRFRRWSVNHWWPARIRQLNIELVHYRRWLRECEERIGGDDD